MGILKKIFLVALLLVATQLVHAQPTLSKADKQYDLHAYNMAIKSYLRVLERQPNNVDALSKLADCYYYLNRMEEAQTYYERAIKTGKTTPQVHFQYGQTLKSIGQYQLAKEEFLKYANSYPIDGNQFAESCDFAMARLNEASQYSIRGEYVNTTAADFGATFYRDYVVFGSARIDMNRQSELSGATSTWTGSAKNQLFISTRDENQYLTPPNFLRSDLTNKYGEGPVAYSPDGRYVAITKNNFSDGTRQLPETGIEMSIYLAEVSANGDWEDPIPFPHNGPGFSNGYPCFSPDGQALYFSSDRADGFGGFDLYVSYRVGNTWSEPENLGAIVNTVRNEITPFFDGQTIYFASDWHKGFGGYDIFQAKMNNRRFSNVEHLGTGINSPRDDYGYIYNSVANIGYFTSNRVGGRGNEDLYRVRQATNSIAIRVYNASDGQPIPGALVDFSSCGQGQFATAANGVLTFNAKQGMSCTGVVNANGFISNTFSVTNSGFQANRTIDVALQKVGEEYMGAVLDVVNSLPLDGVNIRATNQSNGAIMETMTDYQGRFSLGLASYTSYIIRYSRAGFVDVNRTVSTGPGQDRSILGTISLTPTGALGMAETNPQNVANTTGYVPSGQIPKQYNAPSTAPLTGTSMQSGYAVQVAAFAGNKFVDLTSFQNKVGAFGNIYLFEVDNKKKVRLGPFSDKNDAKQALADVKKHYGEAFIVTQTPIELPVSSASGGSSNYSAPSPQQPADYYVPQDIPQQYGNTPYKGNPYDYDPNKNTYLGNTSNGSSIMIQLGAFQNTASFDHNKVADIGVLLERAKGNLTLMLLSGYATKADAERALATAKTRGFNGAYLVQEDGSGSLVRVR